MGASSRAGRRAFPPGSHALDPEVRPVIVIRPRARGCERRVGREPRPAPEPLGDDRRAMRPDARDRQCPVSVRAGAGDPPGPDHAGISLRGAEGGAAGGFMLPGASVRPRTQRLRGLGVGRDVLNVERLLGSSWDSTLYGKGRGGSMRGKGGSGPGLTSDVAVLDMPVDRRARYTNAMAADPEGGRGLRARRMCVGVDGDRDSAVYFPGFGTISSRETFADTRLTPFSGFLQICFNP